CRTHRLWGRIAVKEAARRIWQAAGEPARFPADLAVAYAPDGRPLLVDLASPRDHNLPAVSITHAEGLTMAIAARDPRSRAGLDVVLVPESSERPEESQHLTIGELALLAPWSGEPRREWMARLVAARQAAAKAVGLGPGGAIDRAEVRFVEAESG